MPRGRSTFQRLWTRIGLVWTSPSRADVGTYAIVCARTLSRFKCCVFVFLGIVQASYRSVHRTSAADSPTST